MKTRLRFRLLVLAIVAILLLPLAGHAAPPSPFVGKWQAVDVDGSDIRLTIAGPPGGPFQITSTDSYISFCGGEAGIVRGTGWLREGDPNVLEADLHLECFTTGASLDFHAVWHYDPATGTLCDPDAMWYRSGQPRPAAGEWQIIAHPDEDWVEGWGFDEGALVSLRIFGDGDLLYADTAVASYPDWDPDHACVQLAVGYDLKAGDHVWMTDGTTAKDLVVTNLAIEGVTLMRGAVFGVAEPGSQVEVEYYADPEDPFFTTADADQYGNWAAAVSGLTSDVAGLASQSDGDGDLTRVVFVPPPSAVIVASEAGEWFWTSGFAEGELALSIYESQASDAELLWSGAKTADEWGFVFVDYSDHSLYLEPGNYLVVSDGFTEKDLVLETISMEVFDTGNEIMAGTAPGGRSVWACAGEQDYQTPLVVTADPETGAWTADFAAIDFDITEPMRTWSYAHIYDEDGDANEAGAPPPPAIYAFPWDGFAEGVGWPMGSTVTLSIGDFGDAATAGPAPWDPSQTYVRFDLRAAGYNLETGDLIVMTDGGTTKELVVSVDVTDVHLGERTVSGVYDPALEFHIGIGEQEPLAIEFADSTWVATFSEIEPGAWGGVDQPDADGDNTHITFRAPAPVIFAHPAYELVEGREWAPGAEVTLQIDNPATGEGVEYTQVAVAGDPINYFFDTWARFELAGDFDLQAGHRLTMTDGRYTQSMVVSTLQVTGFDLGAHTVFGVGDPGSELWFPDHGAVLVDGSGSWSATFDDLLPGTWWTVIHRYPDGNEVRETFCVPAPMM